MSLSWSSLSISKNCWVITLYHTIDAIFHIHKDFFLLLLLPENIIALSFIIMSLISYSYQIIFNKNYFFFSNFMFKDWSNSHINLHIFCFSIHMLFILLYLILIRIRWCCLFIFLFCLFHFYQFISFLYYRCFALSYLSISLVFIYWVLNSFVFFCWFWFIHHYIIINKN